MIKRLLSPKGIGAGSIIISVTTILSYILGLLRDRVFAQYFGTTIYTDAYQSAFIIPDIILNICVVGALSGVFIPMFIDALHESQEEADDLADTFITVMGLVLIIASAISYILLPWLLPLVIPANAPAEGVEAAMALSKVMLIFPFLVGLSNTFGAILQSYHRFLSYGIASILYNLGIMVGIVLFAGSMGVVSAGVGVVIGFALHMLIRLLELHLTPFRYRPRWKVNNARFKKILVLMWPRVVTLVTLVIVLREFSFVGYSLPEGSNTAAAMARNFQSFAISVFGVAVATAALPALSKKAAAKDEEGFGNTLYQTVTQTLTFALPSAIGLAFVAEAMISVIIKGGAFNERSLAMTSTLLVLFTLSIPFESLMHVYSRAFYAWKRVWIPTLASVVFAVVTIAFVEVTKAQLGVMSFAIGWTLGTSLQGLILILWMHMVHKHSNPSFAKFPLFFIKLLGINLTMAAVLYALQLLHLGHLYELVLSIVVGGGVYLLLGALLKLEGLDRILGLFTIKKKTTHNHLQ